MLSISEATTHNLHFHDSASIFSIDIYRNESDCNVLATAGGDHEIRLWSISTSSSFTKSDNLVYTSAVNSSIKIGYLRTLSAHTKCVNCVRFDSFGVLASCGDSGSVFLWKERTIRVRAADGDDAIILCWMPETLVIGFASGNLEFYEIRKSDVDEENNKKESENEENNEKERDKTKEDFCENISDNIQSSQMTDSIPKAINETDDIITLDVKSESQINKQPTNKTKSTGKFKLLQKIKCHSDVIQGLTYNGAVLATQSRDKTVKLITVVKDKWAVFRTIRVNSENSFFQRINFIGSNFLFLSSCMVDNKFYVPIYSHPFRELFCKIGDFDGPVLNVMALKNDSNDSCSLKNLAENESFWGLIAATKRSVYFIKTTKEIEVIKGLTFRNITDVKIIDNIVFVSSLDGFISSIRLEIS